MIAVLPFPLLLLAAIGLLVAALDQLPRPDRHALLVLNAVSLCLGGLVYGLAIPGEPQWAIGPARFGLEGLLAGLRLTTRVVAYLTLFALAARLVPARELLPVAARRPLTLYFSATLLRLLPALREEARRIREAQAVRGREFRPGLRGARSWLPVLIPLFVATLRRSRDQALVLRLAGLPPAARDPGARRSVRWALVPALACLAVAGRLVLVPVPGVSLSYFVVFLAGVAYGPLVGLLVGALSRTASDLAISGLHPVILLMVPVEAFLGLLAGVLGRLVNFGQREREPWIHAAVLAGTVGWMFTAAFSVAADTATWLVYAIAGAAEGAAGQVLWTTLVVSGLLFNVPAAVFNAIVFGTATYPTLRALRAAELLPRTARFPTRKRLRAPSRGVSP